MLSLPGVRDPRCSAHQPRHRRTDPPPRRTDIMSRVPKRTADDAGFDRRILPPAAHHNRHSYGGGNSYTDSGKPQPTRSQARFTSQPHTPETSYFDRQKDPLQPLPHPGWLPLDHLQVVNFCNGWWKLEVEVNEEVGAIWIDKVTKEALMWTFLKFPEDILKWYDRHQHVFTFRERKDIYGIYWNLMNKFGPEMHNAKLHGYQTGNWSNRRRSTLPDLRPFTIVEYQDASEAYGQVSRDTVYPPNGKVYNGVHRGVVLGHHDGMIRVLAGTSFGGNHTALSRQPIDIQKQYIALVRAGRFTNGMTNLLTALGRQQLKLCPRCNA